MNQVYCLYRVSTNHQLLEDDIPLQRQACHEFAEATAGQLFKSSMKGVSLDLQHLPLLAMYCNRSKKMQH